MVWLAAVLADLMITTAFHLHLQQLLDQIVLLDLARRYVFDQVVHLVAMAKHCVYHE